MRAVWLGLFSAGLAVGQVSDVVARVKAMKNPRQGAALLEKAVRSCEGATAPNGDCADAYDWYGIVLQVDRKPETLSRVEPLYRRALELREGAGPRALSLELESQALKEVDGARADLLWAEAARLRAESVRAIGAVPPESVGSERIPLPPPMDKPGNGVTPPSVYSKVDPDYAEEARLIKYSGTVLLAIVVNASGRAASIEVKRGLGFGLDEKAAEAVRKWVFRPGMKAGSPVDVRAQIEVNFRLL